MALAPGHRLGQIIGDALEASIEPVLREFAELHGLYLDVKGRRPARGKKSAVAWVDSRGNSHDLDFVLERGGTDEEIGTPAAFIESAWRRYTKHSRNKAQEIQGAVEPLLTSYAEASPFAGAVLAGVWTKGALDQLRSVGFSVLHIEYPEVVEAFRVVGMNIDYDEDTPDEILQAQVDIFESLSAEERARIAEALRECATDEYEHFIGDLKGVVARAVSRVVVQPLHGVAAEYESIEAASHALAAYRTEPQELPFLRFEVRVWFSNGDKIEAVFHEATDAVAFLLTFD